MIENRRIVVVMPAYNAEATLRQTLAEVPMDYVDEVILVDDGSHDRTVALAKELGITTFVHPQNRGYGGNQKTCYREALRRGADVVVMVHPDYQYSPRLIVSMAGMIISGHYQAVLGSRILCGGSLKGGMPLWKYIANRALTLFQNICLSAKLSEYHSGFRAFSAEVLKALPLEENSDDFVFDNEMLAQLRFFDYPIGEISCPTRYEPNSSSISFWRSVRYGLGVLAVTAKFLQTRIGWGNHRIFLSKGKKLLDTSAAPPQ